MRERVTLKDVGLMVADAGVIAVLVAGAGLLVGPAYGGAQYLLALIVGALAGGLAALIPALLRWPGWTTVPAVVVLYLLCGAVAVPSTAVGGVLPSLESVRLLGVGVVTSWKEMLTVAVPVGNSGALLVPIYLSALVCSAVGGLIALRTEHAGWALLAPVAMAATAAVLGAATAGFVVVIGTLGALGGLIWAAWRRRRFGRAGLAARRPLALLAVVVPAVAAGVLLGPQLLADQPRTIARDVVQPPFDPQTLPSPLSGFRSYVKKNRDTVLFSVSGLPAGSRVRLAVMDDYNGLIYGTSPDTGVFNRVGDRIASVPAGDPAQLTVQIKGYSDVWLPDAGYLSGIVFTGNRASALTEQFRYDAGSGVGVVTGGLTDGDGYTATVSMPAAPDPAAMTDVPVITTSEPTPLKVPQEVKDKAAEWAGDATSPYQIATALQQGLRDAGYVSHGDDGALNSPAGHGADRIRRLLTAPIMVGDQEQYAVTMALMARSLGMPARVVMGFEPTGDAAAADVTGRMVTAWVEIPFAGVGWVAFDPTPDEAKVPQQKDDKQSEANRQNRVQPPPPPPDTRQGDTRSVKDADQQDQQEDDKNDDDLPPPAAAVHWVRWVLIGLSPLVLLLPATVVLLLKVLRRRRRQAGPPAERIAGGWAHVLDAATDLGVPPARGATRQETAGAIDARFGGSTAMLAREADTRVWAPDDVQPADADRFWAEVDAAVTGLSRTRGPWGRLRARLSIRSLRRNDPR
jgi:transglutaminase-like putative cysteine protease